MLRTVYQHRNLCFKSHSKNKSGTHGASRRHNYDDYDNNDNNYDHYDHYDHYDFAGRDTFNYYQHNDNSANDNNATNDYNSPARFSISGT